MAGLSDLVGVLMQGGLTPSGSGRVAVAQANRRLEQSRVPAPFTGVVVERWVELGAGVMMEVKAIEVARSWRWTGIASRILNMVVDHPQIEDKIFYMVGYSWTWDLKGTRKTAQEYRAMLVHLFEQQGFQVFETNEPNVCLKPENVLMCRLGDNISREMKDRFKWLRFGLRPWAWKV